ncbi:para-aminobenzoate synthetase component 2 [Gracilibacillus ureilyticus]|uniref:Para-aminobenzoate synthetase component 2 n=1 Tax=Gracilibacillus ureilyticus TaxID=531814 RepID=A0A1H9S2R3_9BACI|nr:aminodeoxychorismate/anthranilate synthase component II [Gracilibacillus ureilyticus]SER79356.1 para-aminobenzoate synthetase component 2 [Gracilibacillus ureilyticus]
MIVIIDNYDSFTYNLVQYYRQMREDVTVYRNDSTTIEEIASLNPSLLVLSPGPGSPANSGISLKVLEHFHDRIPIFGVCLGMQIIVEYFGGNVVKSHEPVHGMTSLIHHKRTGVFHNLPSSFRVTRYHSLITDKYTFPQELSVTAVTDDDTIMAVKHQKYPIEGVQFHPEAILTEYGYELVANSLRMIDHVPLERVCYK